MDRMFTELNRGEGPLDQWLNDCARIVREAVATYPRDAFDRKGDEELYDLAVSNSRLAAGVVAREADPQANPEPATVTRTDGDGTRHEYWRWIVKFPVQGGTEMLGYWPQDLEREPLSGDQHGHPAPDVFWEAHGDYVLAKFDVSVADDRDGTFPVDRLAVASGYLDDAIDALNQQYAGFMEALRQQSLAELAKRRADLERWGEQINEAISLEIARHGPVEIGDGVAKAAAPKAPAGRGEVAVSKIIETRTFRDLVGTTLRWAAAATRYGAAFSQLEEEAITGLLVATLNAVFDTAHREVFQNGKTDIFVESFRDDRENAAYFGEAKKWGGPAAVKGDIEQTLDYCNAATSEAMLLYYVLNQKLGDVVEAARVAVEESGLLDHWESDEFGNDVAVITHPELGTRVTLHMVYVHMRKPGASASATGAEGTSGGADAG